MLVAAKASRPTQFVRIRIERKLEELMDGSLRASTEPDRVEMFSVCGVNESGARGVAFVS